MPCSSSCHLVATPTKPHRPSTHARAHRRLILVILTSISAGFSLATATISTQALHAQAFPDSQPTSDNSDIGVRRQIDEPAGPPRAGDELLRITETVSSKLRCPVCQGMSVIDSPSASAIAMKNEISELLGLGYSEAQVKNYFESTYGEFVLLDPKRVGLNWLLWLAPGCAFFGGLLWIGLNRRRLESKLGAEDLAPYLDQVKASLEGKRSIQQTDLQEHPRSGDGQNLAASTD